MKFQTVTGLVPVETVGLADSHAHVWIAPQDGVAPDVRIELHDFDRIEAGLRDFCALGGTLLVDCQPGGAGRDTTQLAALSRATGLFITSTTGFHRRIYYPPDDWLWSATEDEAVAYFVEELTIGTRESGGTIRATTIKIGYEDTIEGQTRVLMEAVAEAARQTGALVLFHTEAGRNVEALPPFFAERGVSPSRLYLCHVDKRPDVGLHRELAQAGVLLGYDTFARPKYNPEQNVWKLLPALVADGLGEHIAICLDLAFPEQWEQYGGGPGLRFLPTQVLPRLRADGIEEATIARLTGGNIARYLVHQSHQE
jgi:phosphotriesterase-related protein